MANNLLPLVVIVVVVVGWLPSAARAAILDPMTVMKDDISRIKVMMEHLGGKYIHKRASDGSIFCWLRSAFTSNDDNHYY